MNWKRKKFKVSFCIVCMNRLHHLRQTLIQNLEDNSGYDSLEVILLNYNSTDGMDDWVKNSLMSYISAGKVHYYQTTTPVSWNPSHSKNIAFRLATGDIICNIWADYYAGKNFANYVNERFMENPNIVLTPIDFHKTSKIFFPPGDILGKVCVKKDDFIKVNGFDEKINKHGFEDYDFINRLEFAGVQRRLLKKTKYLKFLPHSDSERYDLRINELKGIFVKHVRPSSSKILILYDDQTYFKATIIDNTVLNSRNPVYAYTNRNFLFDYTLSNRGWEKGTWEQDGSQIFTFSGESVPKYTFDITRKEGMTSLTRRSDGLIFFQLDNIDLVRSILEFKHFYDTRKILERNLSNRLPIVNKHGFGEGVVNRFV